LVKITIYISSSFAAKNGGRYPMSSKLAIVVIAVTLAIIMTGFARNPVQADETPGVEYTNYSPDPVIVNRTMSIETKLTGDTNVTDVYLSMCTDIVCLPPEAMELGTDDVWRIDTTIKTVEPYKFQFLVQLDNGSTWSSEYIHFMPVSTVLEVAEIFHSPGKVLLNKEVDVYVTLEDIENVTAVHLTHCKGDVCYTPIEMVAQSNGTYHARIGPFSTEEEIKYNVTASYEDGHTAWTIDYPFTPTKKSGGNGDDDDGFIPALGAVAVIAVLAGLAVTHRGRKD
jgi:hypothetical protein